MDSHPSICYSGYVIGLIIPDSEQTELLLVSLRGRGRWWRSIHGSGAYRTRKVHPYDVTGKLLQRRGQTLKPDSWAHLLRHSLVSLHTWRSPVKRDRGTWGLVSRGFRCGPPSSTPMLNN